MRVYVQHDAVDAYTAENEGGGGHPVPLAAADVHSSVAYLQRQAREGNVTWFCEQERDNPIFFFEQDLRCYWCGCTHYVVGAFGGSLHRRTGNMHDLCCRGGEC
eukprot:1364616-Prymnesium_polylepis.1